MIAEESIARAAGPVEAGGPSPDFRVGRILTRACRIGFRRSLVFLPIAAISVLPFTRPVRRQLLPWAVPWAGPEATWLLIAPFVVIAAVVECIIVHAVFAEVCGRKARLRISIHDGLARALPNIAIVAAQIIASCGGLLLLVAPGLIAACSLYVSTPVCVIEKQGMIASLRRSVELTRGYRWRVLALFLLRWLVHWAGGVGLQHALSAFSVFDPVARQIATLAWTAVFVVLAAAVATVAYHDLRVAKEGLVGNRLAAIFD